MSIAPTPAPATLPTGVLDRVDLILELVEEGVRTVPSLARRTGLPRSTVHRLSRDLQHRGYLAYAGATGLVLGPRLLRLAASAMRDLPLRDLAHPVLERLRDSTGESAQLYVRSGTVRVCIDAVQSESELRTIIPVGASLPLTAGSAGKVFLAYLPDHMRDELIASATATTDRTPVGEELASQVRTAKRRGLATSSGERERGVGSVSAPVLDRYGTVHAVVSLSGPATRMGRISAGNYAPAVSTAAHDIERALGLRQP